MMRRTERRRLRAESGFWKTICSARTSSGRASRARRQRPAVELDRRPPSARRSRAARGRASSCRCRTRRRGRASPPARAAPTRRRAPGVVPSCVNVLPSLSSRRSGVSAARRASAGSTAPSRRRAAAPAHARGSGSGSVPARRARMSRRLLRAADLLGERAAVRRRRTPAELGAERRQEAGDRVQPAAVLAQAAARDAAQQADGVRVPRVVRGSARRGPPRRARRRRARRPGRTSCGSRRGCG